jgi:hypothetical protein
MPVIGDERVGVGGEAHGDQLVVFRVFRDHARNVGRRDHEEHFLQALEGLQVSVSPNRPREDVLILPLQGRTGDGNQLPPQTAIHDAPAGRPRGVGGADEDVGIQHDSRY